MKKVIKVAGLNIHKDMIFDYIKGSKYKNKVKGFNPITMSCDKIGCSIKFLVAGVLE